MEGFSLHNERSKAPAFDEFYKSLSTEQKSDLAYWLNTVGGDIDEMDSLTSSIADDRELSTTMSGHLEKFFKEPGKDGKKGIAREINRILGDVFQ